MLIDEGQLSGIDQSSASVSQPFMQLHNYCVFPVARDCVVADS